MPSAAPTRWQRYRARKRNGRVLLEIEIDEVAVEQWLKDHGELRSDGAQDHAELAAALTRLIGRFIAAAAEQR